MDKDIIITVDDKPYDLNSIGYMLFDFSSDLSPMKRNQVVKALIQKIKDQAVTIDVKESLIEHSARRFSKAWSIVKEQKEELNKKDAQIASLQQETVKLKELAGIYKS